VAVLLATLWLFRACPRLRRGRLRTAGVLHRFTLLNPNRRKACFLQIKFDRSFPRCDCGRELPVRRRLCPVCAAERERLRKKRAYHERKSRPRPEPLEAKAALRCKACGAERETGHTYCSQCAERRRKVTRRQVQGRYWRRRHVCQGLD